MNRYRKFTLNDMNIPIVFFSLWKSFWRYSVTVRCLGIHKEEEVAHAWVASSIFMLCTGSFLHH